MTSVRILLPSLVAAAVTVLGAAPATPASTTSAPVARAAGAETYRNVHTGLCMDDSDGGGLRGWQCNGLNHQKWVVTRHAADGTRQLTNMATSRCLDDSAAGLRTFPCNGLDYQKWTVEKLTQSRIQFRNVKTGACVADPGENKRLIALPCVTNSANQQWQ
ncbi:RICIN domain-containing protein [Streptomyces sp. GQFP]|uniref:RICIN domain-containing protein n=1 Tax=Streptomyces sp. GQFP TaxID=2907545 RepID=UPI001F23419C|nr:RICIN domain-containing protein [Streptomyces sp. GQFP]UIX30981.1 RICIN domain-containing protein [Streptomyces sp. GQFP]